MKARILMADDHRIILEGLSRVITSNGFEVIARCSNGRQAVEKCRQLNPDMAILDISMPELNGIDAISQIVAEQPSVKVLALSMHVESRYVIQALKAGASGYLLKSSSSEQLIQAISTVLKGNFYIDPAIAGEVILGCLNGGDALSPSLGSITPREREIAQLLAEGNSTQEVADRLFLSPKTVDTYRRKMMKKLDLHSIADLTKYAIKEGLTTVDD